jgi:acid phosphatase type 7
VLAVPGPYCRHARAHQAPVLVRTAEHRHRPGCCQGGGWVGSRGVSTEFERQTASSALSGFGIVTTFSSQKGRRLKQLVTLLLLGAAIVLWFAPSASARHDDLTVAADVTVAAAEDIAKCESSGDEKTAALVQALDPDRVVTLGDNVYPDGTISEFLDCYDPSWGVFKRKTASAPGNHDYHTLGGRRLQGILRSIRPVVRVGAYWHRPQYSDGRHGDEPAMEPIWNTFASQGGDIVLAGHDHNYQRFARIDDVRSFVVGTGGARLTPIHGDRARVSNDDTHGVLLLTLRAGEYDWSFEPVAGGTFHESSSSRPCTNDGVEPDVRHRSWRPVVRRA